MYVPYYATSGGMGEGQAMCPAYLSADYIVIQAEFLRRFFDPSVPSRKFLALGSPKFDRVVHMCQNPPAPPAAWRAARSGRAFAGLRACVPGSAARAALPGG